MEEACSSTSSTKKYREELAEKEEDDKKKRIKVTENSSPSTTVYYSCPLCKYHGDNCKLMSQHINRNHKHATLPESTTKLTPKNCIVTDPLKMDEFKKPTTKIFAFPCPISGCNKGYGYKNHLNDHLKAKHSERFNYCCTICGRLEFGTFNMNRHYANVHPTEEFNLKKCSKLMEKLYERADVNGNSVEQVSYPCNVEGCDKVCEFPHQLAVHLKSHDASARTCTSCFKIFSTKHRCDCHFARHHNKELKTFKCHLSDDCQEAFY